MKRAIILPTCWYGEASDFLAGLNTPQSRYFIIPLCESFGPDPRSYLPFVEEKMILNQAESAMIVLPASFACGDKIDFWPSIIQKKTGGNWICSVFFADCWQCVAQALEDLSMDKNTSNKTHLTCQYQPDYTEMLALYEHQIGQPYHPGDYFKPDILHAISLMEGNWLYWGHGEGDKLRGYSQLDTVDLLSNKCRYPLNSTLWFTCSTLDRDFPENIALAWYQSGATKCLLASPYKINTKANVFLSRRWVSCAVKKGKRTIASLILELLEEDSVAMEKVLNKYFLLGIPWVEGNL
ncbi:hypothetical protein [Algoriphagus sp. Y33]|uniref:hypothetical protein n=1 Tax=Algoriphagus sp. Y33 TaxID=2772483 RepID=UPI00177DA614|nr:hypothetical protein [Algoriphagus sp. Y33]